MAPDGKRHCGQISIVALCHEPPILGSRKYIHCLGCLLHPASLLARWISGGPVHLELSLSRDKILPWVLRSDKFPPVLSQLPLFCTTVFSCWNLARIGITSDFCLGILIRNSYPSLMFSLRETIGKDEDTKKGNIGIPKGGKIVIPKRGER